MSHNISTVSLRSSTFNKTTENTHYFFTQVEQEFSVKFITLFQTFLELCNRSNLMLVISNVVEIFAGLYLPVSTCHKSYSLQSPQTRCVLKVHFCGKNKEKITRKSFIKSKAPILEFSICNFYQPRARN